MRVEGGRERIDRERVRFSLRSADWGKFREELRKGVGEVKSSRVHSKGTVITFVKKVERWILGAAAISMKKGVRGARLVNWWNEELKMLQGSVIEARRRYQREKDCERKRDCGIVYREMRNKYKKRVRLVREEKWGEFVDGELGKGPWNLLYKMATGKIKPEKVMSMIGEREGVIDWRDSVDNLLGGLILDDEGDEGIHREIRQRVESFSPEFGERWGLTVGEVRQAVWAGKNGKAPGWDGIALEMVKGGWEVLGEVLRDMYRYCLKYRVFPDRWKWGVIRALLKGEGKDPGSVKSYRPICLLPVLGKILERIIVGKMGGVFCDSVEDRQYGFMKGRGTEDAMGEIRKVVESRGERYVMGIFLDLAGAFDRVWWPGVLDRLREMGVGKEPFEIIRDYLSRRKVEIWFGGNKRRKEVNRGCPQGSILGPQIWKLVFDECIRDLNTGETAMIAYADDGALLVWGTSRVQVEYRAWRALKKLKEWLGKAKMTLSPEKTEMMMLKGDFPTRQPEITVGDRKLSLVGVVKYLGVYWNKGLKIDRHIGYVVEKANNTFANVCRMIKGKTREGYDILGKIYEGLYLAIICYGAGAWGDKLGARQRRMLGSGQRKALQKMSCAYRTTSTDALGVVVGRMPLDLEIEKRWASARLRKKGRVVWRGVELEGGKKRKELREIAGDQWGERWVLSDKGRWTKKFFPEVTKRMECTWVKPDYYITQALTGHGNFRRKLQSFGLCEDGRCGCGEEETVQHVIFDCDRYQVERRQMYKVMDETGLQRTEEEMIGEKVFEEFRKMVTGILKKKEGEERRGNL